MTKNSENDTPEPGALKALLDTYYAVEMLYTTRQRIRGEVVPAEELEDAEAVLELSIEMMEHDLEVVHGMLDRLDQISQLGLLALPRITEDMDTAAADLLANLASIGANVMRVHAAKASRKIEIA